MQVKDYIQSCLDENELRVEKIGSGNWYWSFVDEEARRVQGECDGARVEYGRVEEIVGELRGRVKEAERVREREEETEGERVGLVEKWEVVKGEVRELKRELARYGESDPVEMKRLEEKLVLIKEEVERVSEQIGAMVFWIKGRVIMDRSAFVEVERAWYGEEFDEDTGTLREVT